MALFKVTPFQPFILDSLLTLSVTIAFAILLEYLFHKLIFPSNPDLGSYGAVHSWILWAGQRVHICWDIFAGAFLEILGEFSRILGARQREGAGEGNIRLEAMEDSPQASHPPPYDVSMNYINHATMLTVTLA